MNNNKKYRFIGKNIKTLRRFLIGLSILNIPAYAQPATQYFCFKADHQKNILLISTQEFPEIKTIQYYPYLKKIDLKFSHYDAIDTARDKPSEFHYFYKEATSKHAMGTYEVIYQGAMFHTVKYIAKNTRHPIQFNRIYELDENMQQNLNHQGIDCF
jgi:hypothetical protein